jgi:hypothetical protein
MLALVLAACGGDTPVTVQPDQMPPATVGLAFDVPVTGQSANGAGNDLYLSVKDGSLPPGIAIYQVPGNGTGHGGLRGTPTAAGTYTFTIELGGYCTMGGCVRGSRSYSLVVSP